MTKKLIENNVIGRAKCPFCNSIEYDILRAFIDEDWDVIRIELLDKKVIYCTAFKKSDGWITCYSQGQPRYQIPITEIKMIEYKKNQNIK